MARVQLEAALKAVDWNRNVNDFLQDATLPEQVATANLRLAHWSKQFEVVDHGNPALSFVREMQVAGHYVPALCALGLYKPAAGAMRTMLETALYYTYFRNHPVELATLVRDSSYYVSKTTILEYHKLHTPGFRDVQQKCGVIPSLEAWYARVSAICHGQIPGGWVPQSGLAAIKHSATDCSIVVREFLEGEAIVYKLFLCTVGRELWSDFATVAKRALLKGLPGDQKVVLGLDSA